MASKKDWSKSWKQSTKPSKQRKYRRNAPLHQRHKLLKARLSDKWKDRLSCSTLPLREGDKVEVMRGDDKGLKAEVTEVDYDSHRVELEDLKREKVDGSDVKIPIHASNLLITRPNLDDEMRAKRVEEIKEIKEQMEQEKEEEREEKEEEAAEELEGQKEEKEEKEEEEEISEEEKEEEESEEEMEAPEEEPEIETDTASLVSNNIIDIKDKVESYEQSLADKDQGKMLKFLRGVKQAESNDKDRKTLLNYLESKIDEHAG